MEQKKLADVQKRLLTLKNEEQERASRIKEWLKIPQGSSVGELSVYDNHPGDIGDLTFERGKDLGLALFTEDKLAMIDDALEAVDKGTYGVCAVCGKEIGEDRLKAIPYTTLCQECKKQNEDTKLSGRPVEEEVLALPFGGVQGLNDGADNLVFDGEDTWQAVAKYGTSNSPSDLGGVLDYDDTYVNADEDLGTVEDYEKLVTKKGKDGQHYQDFH